MTARIPQPKDRYTWGSNEIVVMGVTPGGLVRFSERIGSQPIAWVYLPLAQFHSHIDDLTWRTEK